MQFDANGRSATEATDALFGLENLDNMMQHLQRLMRLRNVSTKLPKRRRKDLYTTIADTLTSMLGCVVSEICEEVMPTDAVLHLDLSLAELMLYGPQTEGTKGDEEDESYGDVPVHPKNDGRKGRASRGAAGRNDSAWAAIIP